ECASFGPRGVKQRRGVAFGQNETVVVVKVWILRVETHVPEEQGRHDIRRRAARSRMSAAGSGHPTSCCSAADVMAALFFGHMRFDAKNPHFHNSDRFVLSKGHAAPLLYAAWAEAGAFDRARLKTLREIDSDLEGHPTPRLPFVDVATGSLGPGICAALGSALNARRIGS